MFKYFFASVLLLIGICALFACESKSLAKAAASKDNNTQILIRNWSGVYDNIAQKEADPSYYHAQLKVCPIWGDRVGNWLYAEMSLATDPDHPYRQRIHRIEYLGGNSYQSKVYTLPDEELFAGSCERPDQLRVLKEKNLVRVEGCDYIFEEVAPGVFKSGNTDKTCPSKIKGAVYSRTKLEISPTSVFSQIDHFDEFDELLENTPNGTFEFIRLKDH